MYKIFSCTVLLALSIQCIAQFNQRLNCINDGWEYCQIDSEILPDESAPWQQVTLPHTWNALDATDNEPGYRRGTGWYSKKIDLVVNGTKKHVLYFEGANITTKVFINKKLAGGHIGGYVGFEIDITPFLVNGENEILVRVDNDLNPEVIPSFKADFFIFGGITRDVWLKIVSVSAHVQQVKIATPSVSKELGQTSVAVSLNGDEANMHELILEVLNRDARKVFEKKIRITSKTETIDFAIKEPILWHVDSPHLYTARVKLIKDGQIVDEVSERYGYRWFEFKEYGAFYLNGERLKLRGTHRHEEHAGFGAAVPNEIHRKDIQMIKEMGANMIRLAHYPQDPEVYKACDELGLIVWDELPWCRGGLGNDLWKSNTKRLLREMIVQNYNHPSIVFWSLGNEVYWLPDFEGGDDREKINSFLWELNDLAHAVDPSRLTSIRKYYEGSHIPDVFSPSIWSGWYSGKYTDYEASIQEAMKKYKHFLHAEYGGSSHKGRHSESIKSLDSEIESTLGNEAIVQVNSINYAQDGDWSENYIVDLFDWHLRVSESTPDFAGNLQWAFKDFGTPLRPENDIPYINQKGLVDREGNPKDAYYVFKSYWSAKPFVYIESSTWTERYGGEGENKEISVYSNCDQVELIHNGTNLGQKKKDINVFPASGLTWSVPFQEGKNLLIATGISNKGSINDTLSIKYYYTPPGTPRQLELSYEKKTNGTLLITARATDENGRLCTNYQKKVYFQSIRGGDLKRYHGIPTGSDVIALANGQASIEFQPDLSGKMPRVMVLNQDFKGTYMDIPIN